MYGGYFLFSLYGDKWMGAVLPLSVLSVFGFSRAQTDLCGDLLIGTGSPGQFRKVNAVQLAVAVAGLYAGAVLGGIPGVALAMTVAASSALVVAWRYAGRAVGGRAVDFARAFRGPVVAFAVLLLPAIGLRRLLPGEGSLPAVALAVVAVSVVYLSVWLAADPGLRRDLSDWKRTRRDAAPGANGGRP